MQLPDSSVLCHQCLVRLYEQLPRRTIVMGILNVTPDSFSDGGMFRNAEVAVAHGVRMAANGADIIDVGGESTRPGADSVSVSDEIERVLPVIHGLKEAVDVPISVDTSKAEVADAALMAGAHVINDVTGLQADPGLAAVAARHGAPLVLMHMKGSPGTMQDNPHYDDLVGEVSEFLRRQVQLAASMGLSPEWTIVDPGFGFGKTAAHNIELIRRLREFTALGRPVMIGTSRKSTLGMLLGGAPPLERLEATAASVALAIANGANIVRVHDVREMVRVARVADAIVRSQP